LSFNLVKKRQELNPGRQSYLKLSGKQLMLCQKPTRKKIVGYLAIAHYLTNIFPTNYKSSNYHAPHRPGDSQSSGDVYFTFI